MGKFSSAQWNKIHQRLDVNEQHYGLPIRSSGSFVFASFNIRKFGALKKGNKVKRSAGSWKLLVRFCERCDLIAIQEVGDDLTSVMHLVAELGPKYEFLASGITGGSPGSGGNIERLVYVYRTDRLHPTGMSGNISYERSDILNTLYNDQDALLSDFEARIEELKRWQEKVEKWEQAVGVWKATGFTPSGKKTRPDKPSKPSFSVSLFLQFIRTPYAVSFKTIVAGNAKPYGFIAVNAHLLYGGNDKRWKGERLRELKALVDWLVIRGQKIKNLREENIILFGDLNLDFEKIQVKRESITAYLKTLNETRLKKAAKVNIPFIDAHPGRAEVFRTNARRNQTFDQIAFLAGDKRLPPPHQNDNAGEITDRFDFGMFDFVQLFLDAVPVATKSNGMPKYDLFEFDVSDHMPIWIRLQKPASKQKEFRWR